MNSEMKTIVLILFTLIFHCTTQKGACKKDIALANSDIDSCIDTLIGSRLASSTFKNSNGNNSSSLGNDLFSLAYGSVYYCSSKRKRV